MKYLFRFLKPHIKTVLLLMLLYAAQTLCALFMPYVMSNIVELGIRNGDTEYIFREGAVMIALAAGALACALLTNAVGSTFSARLAADIRKQVFNKVNTLTFEQFSALGTGSLITRTTDDVGWVEETVAQLPYVLITAPIMFIGGVVLSFRGDWVLPLILLGAAIPVLAISTAITMSLEKHWQRGERYTDVQNRVVRERLIGIRVVRAFDREEYEHDRAKVATTEMCNSFVRANTVSGLISPIASLLLNIATVAIVYVGAVRLDSSSLRAGDILATIQYIALIANAILILSWTISMIPHVRVSLGRIGEIMELQSSRDEQSLGITLDGDIRFDGVSFAYGGSHVNSLEDINFEANRGEIVGIIGGTGSGKTTLVKLLADFYSPSGGSRSFGSRNYDELTPATIRDNVSVALQKSMIFEGTIADNVRMGYENASDEEVQAVIEAAQLADFVRSAEAGLDYKLTQAGSNLSGGQKQRINIARALLKPALVYIFDDSFSALDYLTESRLRKAMNAYLDGKTQIIVTQRAATAMRCDRVYVLDNGRVAGVGTHSELLTRCPIYREIYDSQMGGDICEKQN